MAWPNFSVTTAYATLISGINTAFQAVGKLFKDQTTGDYVDQIRYNSSTDRFEYWTGSAWAELPMAGTSAGTAATLATARTIGGVAFDGSANINLPGVNTTGNQNTSGNAATATSAGACTGNSSTATYASSAGACTGNSSTATYASSAGNSDTLDGLHAASLIKWADTWQSLAGNGYIRLPGGLIIQWGTYTGAAGAAIAYPVSFPAAVVHVGLTARHGGNIGLWNVEPGLSTFYWHDSSIPESVGVKWLAIGW